MVGFNKFQSENDRPFSDNPAAAVFFFWGYQQNMALIIEIEWECSQGTWGNSEILMDSSHIWLKTFHDWTWLNEKNLDIRIQYLVAEDFFENHGGFLTVSGARNLTIAEDLHDSARMRFKAAHSFFPKPCDYELWPYYDHIMTIF